jgi:riboflavin synthase
LIVFTGIVEEVGRISDMAAMSGGFRFTIEADIVMDGLREGDSIAVDGVCQTVVSTRPRAFTVEAIATTLSRTTLGGLSVGSPVNLERSLAFGARVGGHLVQGHVDGTADVLAVERRGEHVLLDVRLPAEVADVTVPHGSITIHGVSLTANEIRDGDIVQVALIPYTWEHTNLSRLAVGDRVNVEGDVLGKFVANLMKRRSGSDEAAVPRS